MIIRDVSYSISNQRQNGRCAHVLPSVDNVSALIVYYPAFKASEEDHDNKHGVGWKEALVLE